MSRVLSYLRDEREAIMADLRQFVIRESPSDDKACLDILAKYLAEYGEWMTGGRVELIHQDVMGDHVVIRVGDASHSPTVLIVGHFDTVWPVGTLEVMPFSVESGVVRGPGVFDMKAGLVQGFWAIRAIRETGGRIPSIVFLLNSDEEVGSPTSRKLIEQEAKRADVSLILEPSCDGALKTARKGVGNFTVEVTGRAAHAGNDPGKGISAVDEACRLTLELHSYNGPENEATVNVGVFNGGTRRNVVAAAARLEVDIRVPSQADAERLTKVILGLRPHHAEARVRVSGGISRPPMERTASIGRLFLQARSLAAELGFDLQEASVGGGSDGNFCASVNPLVLDGLGAVGDGAHALSEHVVVDQLAPRSALVARLLETVCESTKSEM